MKWPTRIVLGIFVAFIILLFTNSSTYTPAPAPGDFSTAPAPGDFSTAPAPDSFVDTTLNQPTYNTSMLPPVEEVDSSLITPMEDADSLAQF